MNVSLKGTTLACGFAGALLTGVLAGCGEELNENAEPASPPAVGNAALPEEIADDPSSRSIRSLGEKFLNSKPRSTFGGTDELILPVPAERLAEGAMEVNWSGQPSVVYLNMSNVPPLPLASFTSVEGSEAKVTREDGVLRLVGGPGFVRSEETYDDFILQCEVELNAPDSNSGIFFRTMEPTAENPSNGYEMQLQNTLGPGGRTDPDDYGDGFGTGGIFRRQAARYVNADDGEWFHVTLVAVGNRMATWVNGLQVTDFTDERDPDPNPRKGRRDEAGYLVLQGHDPTTDVSFRNVRIQELSEPADDSTESD